MADFCGALNAAFRGGLHWLQVREKDLDARELLDLVRTAVAAARRYGARVLVNGRPDLAVMAGADGVHLPEDGLAPGEVRRTFPHLLVGASVHSPARAGEVSSQQADFVLFGPIFPSPGKERFAQGIAELAEAVRQASAPVVAVGGIEPARVGSCLAAGAGGVAAIRGIWGAADIAAATRRYLDELASSARG